MQTSQTDSAKDPSSEEDDQESSLPFSSYDNPTQTAPLPAYDIHSFPGSNNISSFNISASQQPARLMTPPAMPSDDDYSSTSSSTGPQSPVYYGPYAHPLSVFTPTIGVSSSHASSSAIGESAEAVQHYTHTQRYGRNVLPHPLAQRVLLPEEAYPHHSYPVTFDDPTEPSFAPIDTSTFGVWAMHF